MGVEISTLMQTKGVEDYYYLRQQFVEFPFTFQAESWSGSSFNQVSTSVGGESLKDGEKCGRDQQEHPEVQPDCAKHAPPEVPRQPCKGG